MYVCVDYYVALGVSPTASASEIKKAFFEVRSSCLFALLRPTTVIFVSQSIASIDISVILTCIHLGVVENAESEESAS